MNKIKAEMNRIDKAIRYHEREISRLNNAVYPLRLKCKHKFRAVKFEGETVAGKCCYCEVMWTPEEVDVYRANHK